MQLIRHVEKHEDFFLPSPDNIAWDLPGKLYGKEKNALAFSEVETVFPATEVQRDILNEDVQWAEVELFSGKPSSFGLENIFNAWTSLASHHACLRSYITILPETGQPQVVVLRRIEGIRWNHTSKSSKASGETPAYVTVEGTHRLDEISLVLHFHRALIDTTSLHMIKLDYALQIHGLPSIESTGFATLFWAETLTEVVPQPIFGLSPVFFDKTHNATQDRHGVSAVIRGSELAKLNDLNASHGLASWRQTFFELVWAHVLSAHTGSDEVVFGTVRRDENFIGSDTCIGCVDQTYPVRFRVAGDQKLTVLDASRALDVYHSQAGRHAFVGLEEIQRQFRYSHVVETAVSYSQTTNAPCIAPGLRSFPVVLCISDAGVLRVTLKCKAYIPLEEIEIVLQHFVAGILNVSSKMSLEKDYRLSNVDLISEDEKHALIPRSLATPTVQLTTISALFEKTAALHPSKIAVDFEGSLSLTFSELNSKANVLARRLKLEKGSLVPILSERSIYLVVAILAVLKSGAAYTVLDPEIPTSRLEQIVDDCKPATILASRQYINVFLNATDIQQVLYSGYGTSPSSPAELDNLNIEVDPEDRCYIIYTSGSTGKPKGAVLTHRAATSGMVYHSLNGLDRWLLFYNPSFSAAQRTILGTLVHGGTLVLASKESLTNDLAGVVNRLSVDSLGITPSALALLKPDQVPGLKQITLVGEQIPQDLVEIWSKRDSLRLRNTYGLSECTQLNFGRELRAQPGGVANPRIVGSPADTTHAFILQQGTTEPSPLLVSGELCLSGPQLAEGYINEPALTARVFIDNPFGPGKLYRTGDKARRLADGQIEIQGRIDMQAKINGQKVEPVEIDRLLRAVSVFEASITLAVHLEDRTVLATGVVLPRSSVFRNAVLAAREYLRKRLPAYMVPGIWFPVQEIPKNANGKVNYARLRDLVKELGTFGFAKLMETEGSMSSINSITDDVEINIASSWSAILGVNQSIIRRSHSFSDLGGTSIHAIQVISELRKSGISVDLGDLLGESSLEAVAARSQAFNADAQHEPEPFSLLADLDLASKLQNDGGIIDAYPATPFQEAMLASMNTPSDPYTYSRTWDVSNLDLALLRQSFEQVFRHRDILRTVFVPHKRSFMQTIRDDLALPWIECKDSLESSMSQETVHQWELNGPLWKVTVFSNQILVVTMHHSLFDFWSHRFLYDDVAAVYLGNPIPQRPKFNNFVRHLLSQEDNAHQTFWSSYLEGADLAKLNYSPLDQTNKIEVSLDISLGKRAGSVGLTLGSVVYSAWAILLSRHLGIDDVTFATTVSGRETPVAGIHDIDGPTMTTVPQRVKLEPNATLRDVCKSTLSGFTRLLKHSQLGMLGALRAGNLPSHAIDTLVNILVKNGDAETGTKDSQGVFRMYGRRTQWASGSDTTVLEVEEDRDITIVRLVSTMESRRLEFVKNSFLRLVTLLVEQPDAKLASTAIIDDTEYDFIYNTLSNRKTLHIPEAEFLHSSFERIARDAPDTVAIDFNGEEVISYGTLDNLANRLAHTLLDHDVQPGDLIPLMLDKSVDMMVAILGVMKAGGAYVPLSPDNPSERNAYVVSDTKAKLLVIHPQHAAFGSYVGELHGVKMLVLQNHHELPALTRNGRDANVAPVINSTPDALAYLIYTSGSTGMPKGVKVPHRAAAAAVKSMAQVEGRFQGTWRTLQFANYVFDASVQDFFNTLSTGGTLCMAPMETLLSDIVGCINRMNARQSIITPTVAKLFGPKDVPGFETLIVGGEPLTSDVVDVWGPHCKILNVYGPTETSMVVTTKDVEGSSGAKGHRIGNIGAPFPTVMAFIVNPDGEELVPYGAVGELCIAGPQVTDGYMNRPDLTEAAYIESKQLGTRIYRTGDLARWLPAGEIECLGRKDNQVKIHGHRIELGEVENVIRRSGLVKDTVAIVANVQDKTHLVTFCIFDETIVAIDKSGTQDPSPFQSVVTELRQSLGSLATYMIPKFVIPMTTFPKLPSRKVDRKSLKKTVDELSREYLAQCMFENPGEKHEVIPVQTLTEETLELVWADIFGVSTSQIGREANFFTLGGDSISAISLTGQLRRVGYSLTVLDILKSPKLKEMATTLKKLNKEKSSVKKVFEVPEVVKVAAKKSGLIWDEHVDYAYPCPPGQTEFLKQGNRDSQMWALQTVRRMTPDISPETWVEATVRLTEVNEILRTTWIKVFEDDWVGVILRSPELNLTKVALESEEEISGFIEDFWQTRFEFGRPFIKYAIITHGDSSWDLVIKMDHAVYDGTLLRVFDDHFGAILRGEAITPRVEFRDFVQHVFQEDKSSSLDFWRSKMAGLSPVHQYLHGRDLAAMSSPKVTSSLRREIDTTNIEQAATQLGVTPSIIFQGAFSLWMAAATGTTDVRFDYLLSGRNVALPDPQSINGTLANFLPFRTHIHRNQPVHRFLLDLQDDFWAVTENGLVGLDDIYRVTGLSREAYGNRVLFLSQPFEPAAKDDPNGRYRWLVMAKSKVRMYQPYALVIEVSKSLGERHILKIMYDNTVFDLAVAERIADDITELVGVLADMSKKDLALEVL
ncbi:nonribosomal peptide synthase sidE [Colletotrichum spaethianum]|uniref:Nonribosomal peptide synthase sidE n=1 Tax=Colletotrichum spaethianum TaxID=700344 RepID=A0AA37LB74_9PEZI|nr:nonribosomal peptide synthase sidE [Colletotrichum spaethianum]GKT45446.1 nonribosomal peptide synthase sidE [Colletotrichum spaethianum]